MGFPETASASSARANNVAVIATNFIEVADHFIVNAASIFGACAALVAAISSTLNHFRLRRVNDRTKKIAEATNGSANPQDKPKK
jgi:hypothetical protein